MGGLLDRLDPRLLLGGDPFPDLNLLEHPDNPVVRVETTFGNIDIEMFVNRYADFPLDFIESFIDQGHTHQSVFNSVAGGRLTGGVFQYLEETEFVPAFGELVGLESGLTPSANDERTVAAQFLRMQGPPFSQFLGAPFIINLDDNAPPAAQGEYWVWGRVLGDASWNVVQTIAALPTADLSSELMVSPIHQTNFTSAPITGSWTSGDPVPPELLVQITDVSLVKANGAPDFYRHVLYSAEGFTGSTINEYVPIENPNGVAVHYEVRVRYEHLPNRQLNQRDDFIQRITIPANTRNGLTISTTQFWEHVAADHGVPYAIEIYSTLPLSANLSHYDFGTATGEAFTDELSDTWTFPGLGLDRSFLVWHNPGSTPVDITVTLIASIIQQPTVYSFTIQPHRRGGMALDGLAIQESLYSARIESSAPIVAQLTTYSDPNGFSGPGGYTTSGYTGEASTVGVLPLAMPSSPLPSDEQGGFNIGMLNTGSTVANVQIELYESGSTTPIFTFDPYDLIGGSYVVWSYPVQLTNPGGPLTLIYRSSEPIFMSVQTARTEDYYSTAVAVTAANSYHFADGFADPARAEPNVLETHIAVFNPNSTAFGASDQDAEVNFTFRYTNGSTYVITRTIAAGTALHLDLYDIQEIVDNANNNDLFFFSFEVACDIPIIAQMMHTDATLGDPGRATGGFTSLGDVFGQRFALLQSP